MHYLCIVFFMVLDLRLTKKIEVVVRQPFFFYISFVHASTRVHTMSKLKASVYACTLV